MRQDGVRRRVADDELVVEDRAHGEGLGEADDGAGAAHGLLLDRVAAPADAREPRYITLVAVVAQVERDLDVARRFGGVQRSPVCHAVEQASKFDLGTGGRLAVTKPPPTRATTGPS